MTEQKTTSKLTTRRIITGLIAIFAIVASCWYILRGFQWVEVGKLLGNMDVGCFVLGVFVANVPYWHIRALRWWILMRRCGADVPYRPLHLATVLGVAFAPVTPGQVGEALKVELLHKYAGSSRASGYGTHVVERVFDLGVLLVFGLLGAASGGFPMLTQVRWLMWLGLGGLIAGSGLLWWVRLPGKWGELQAMIRDRLSHFPTSLAVTALTFLSWTLVALGWQLVLRSIGVELPILTVFSFIAAGTFMLILSFVPAGVGVWEAGGSLLLVAIGAVEAEAQAGALALRLFGLATMALATLWWLWGRRRVSG